MESSYKKRAKLNHTRSKTKMPQAARTGHQRIRFKDLTKIKLYGKK
jgi:hypothetical protein